MRQSEAIGDKFGSRMASLDLWAPCATEEWRDGNSPSDLGGWGGLRNDEGASGTGGKRREERSVQIRSF